MKLERNVGTLDKNIRIVIGVLLAAWGLFGAGIASTAGMIALFVGVVLVATGLLKFCYLFTVLGINTIGKAERS